MPGPATNNAAWHANLAGDFRGGITVAVVALPTGLSCGLLAFAPLGPEYASLGLVAGLLTGVFATVVASLRGATPYQITGPRSALAVLLAAVLAGLLQSPHLPAEPEARAAMAIALIFLCVLMAGAFQILLGVLRLGILIKYIPATVVAGLMNGFAIIIFFSQVPVFLGVSNPMAALAGGAGIEPMAAGIGLCTVVVMVVSSRIVPFVPGALVAITVGALLYHVAAPLIETGEAGQGLRMIGEIPVGMPDSARFMDFPALISEGGNLLALLPELVGAALTLALLGSITSLLGALAADSISGTRHDSNRELIAQGLGNMASALFGGLGASGSVLRATVNYEAGGRTRMASVFHALFFLLVVTVLGPLMGRIPTAVIAAVLLVFAFQMVDRRSLRLLIRLASKGRAAAGQDAPVNLFIVVLVTVTTVTADFVTAAGVGLVTASLLFAAKMGRSVIRANLRGSTIRSKTARSRRAVEALNAKGSAISYIEAQGPIFFGSADRLRTEIEDSLADAEFILLDLKRVTDLDDTGLRILRQLDRSITAAGKVFLLSGLSEDRPLWEFVRPWLEKDPAMESRLFPDTDGALTEAEDRLLGDLFQGEKIVAERPLTEMDSLRHMSSEQIAHLEMFLERRTYRAEERILAKGEEADALFFLAAGTVSVRVPVTEGRRMARLAGFRPGVIFGEMAVVEDDVRSADVHADRDAVCYVLSRANFNTLTHQRSDIVVHLLLNMARALATRLRITSNQIAEAEK